MPSPLHCSRLPDFMLIFEKNVLTGVLCDVSQAGSAMLGEILGFELRWRWTDGDKLGFVMSKGCNEVTVTQVAQRDEISRQQIYAWRNGITKMGLWSPIVAALFTL